LFERRAEMVDLFDWTIAKLRGDPAIKKERIAIAERVFADEVAKVDAEMTALIGETLRLHPEKFTQLPTGGWVPNARMTRQ
jgi:hypothetical protein